MFINRFRVYIISIGRNQGILDMENTELLQLYKKSLFYEKYKNSYVSDKILKEVFDITLTTHRLYGLKTYAQVHCFNVKVMTDLLKLFVEDMNIRDAEMIWEMLYAFYVDPDECAIWTIGGVICSADGLLSIRRIYRKYGMSAETVHEYEIYRQVPIFFFPKEKNGVNITRASVFGDRIDCTLYDLKRRFEGKKCKLEKVYNMPKTSIWLSEIGSFENLANLYGIKGIFVNDDYEVYDLEKGDRNILTTYSDTYTWDWSDSYYDNLKKKIDEFMNMRMGENNI